MTECRAALPGELDELLAVMCDAFGLPFGPAREIFYRDPYFDPKQKRVLVSDGQVLSCLTIIQAPIRVGEAVILAAGIAGLATRREHRGNGHATRLLQETLEHLEGEGCGFCGLFPFSRAFYERFGFRTIGRQFTLRAPATAFRSEHAHRHVRSCLPADLSALDRLFTADDGTITGHVVRDTKRWRYILDHVAIRLAYAPRAVEGYAFAEANGQIMRVLELHASEPKGRRALLAALASVEGVKTVEICAPSSGLLLECLPSECPLEEARLGIAEGPMFRIVRFEKALEECLANFHALREPLSLRCLSPDNAADRSFTIVPAKEAPVISPESANPRLRLEAGPETWVRLLLGDLSGEEALAIGNLRAFSRKAATMAEALLPSRSFSIPPADHF